MSSATVGQGSARLDAEIEALRMHVAPCLAGVPDAVLRRVIDFIRTGCIACEMEAINDPRCVQVKHTCK